MGVSCLKRFQPAALSSGLGSRYLAFSSRREALGVITPEQSLE